MRPKRQKIKFKLNSSRIKMRQNIQLLLTNWKGCPKKKMITKINFMRNRSKIKRHKVLTR